MEKSHVSMENKICQVCGVKNNHNCGILLDKRLQQSLERETVTGWGLCEEHDNVVKDGFVIMVVAKNDDTNKEGYMKIEDAERTGEVLYVRKEVCQEMFNIEVKDLMFIDEETYEMLKKNYENAKKELEEGGSNERDEEDNDSMAH